MSRSGRAARKARLIASGQWQDLADWSPSSMLGTQAAADATAEDQARRKQLIAERDEWVRAVGTLGWQRELDRRRGERAQRWRQRRTEGRRTEGGRPGGR